MHHIIVYSIIVLVVLFIIIYINKQILEGYSYIPNLHFNNTEVTPFISPNDVRLSTCEKICDISGVCTGFTSVAVNGSTTRSQCTYYTNKTLDKNNLNNVTWDNKPINLYIK